MSIFGAKTKSHLMSYIAQSVLATMVILIILLLFNILTQTALVASLGASAFIVFTMPHTYLSKPRVVLGGYLIGLSVGISYNYLFTTILHLELQFMRLSMVQPLLGALSVGITIFLMVITNSEHPPSVGLALGLVLNQWNYCSIALLMIAATLLVLGKELLKSHLKNLL